MNELSGEMIQEREGVDTYWAGGDPRYWLISRMLVK